MCDVTRYQEGTEEIPFLYLTADLPPPPLFKDELKENIIPQVGVATGCDVSRV